MKKFLSYILVSVFIFVSFCSIKTLRASSGDFGDDSSCCCTPRCCSVFLLLNYVVGVFTNPTIVVAQKQENPFETFSSAENFKQSQLSQGRFCTSEESNNALRVLQIYDPFKPLSQLPDGLEVETHKRVSQKDIIGITKREKNGKRTTRVAVPDEDNKKRTIKISLGANGDVEDAEVSSIPISDFMEGLEGGDIGLVGHHDHCFDTRKVSALKTEKKSNHEKDL